MGELEGGARVVVEAADQAVIEYEMDSDRLQDLLHLLEVRAAAFVEKLADARKRFDDGLIFGDFAVEDAQRVGDGAALAVGAHFPDDGLERLAQRFVEAGAVGRAAYGVEFERPAGDADAIEQRGQQFENFGVAGGRFATGMTRDR